MNVPTPDIEWLLDVCRGAARDGPHGHALTEPRFAIDTNDVSQLRRGIGLGLVDLRAQGRFNTLDLPTPMGKWALLSFYKSQTILNGEYVPQLACYIDLIDRLGYHPSRVLFEPGDQYCRVDHAVIDDQRNVVIVGEAKVDPAQPDDLVARIRARYADPNSERPAGKNREYESWKTAAALWELRPQYLWLTAPGVRRAYRLTFDPMTLTELDDLPAAAQLGLTSELPSGERRTT